MLLLDPLFVLVAIIYLALGITATVLGARKRQPFALVAGLITLALLVLTVVLDSSTLYLEATFVSPLPEMVIFAVGNGEIDFAPSLIIVDTIVFVAQWTLVVAGVIVGVVAKNRRSTPVVAS